MLVVMQVAVIQNIFQSILPFMNKHPKTMLSFEHLLLYLYKIYLCQLKIRCNPWQSDLCLVMFL